MAGKNLGDHEAQLLGGLAPHFRHLADWEYEFDNGRVQATVNMDVDRRDIGILEWSALNVRQGHTRQALAELRSYFVSIAVIGSYPEDDPENPVAWQCWSQMFAEGLVDFVEDHHGRKLDRFSAAGSAPAVASPSPC